MRLWLTHAAAVAIVAIVAACASVPASKDAGATAQCPVCVYNRDLACIKVRVAENTPRCTIDGKTWYFCSDECRKAFENNPAKYTK